MCWRATPGVSIAASRAQSQGSAALFTREQESGPQYPTPVSRSDAVVNRVVALLHGDDGPSLDSLGLEVGDTVAVNTRYVGVTLSGPGPGLIPGWAGYKYLEYPIAGHRLRSISR